MFGVEGICACVSGIVVGLRRAIGRLIRGLV
jgi:hypothetical protein